MVQVTELGYLVLGVKSLETWKVFATNILGFETAESGETGRCFFRMDYWHHRFVLEEDGTDDLICLGFRVAGPEEFRDMRRQLADGGIAFEICGAEEAANRRVLELIRMRDPSGTPIEIFHGPQVQADKPFHPGRPMHGRFKTGDGGLGHVILRETIGLEKTYQFYRALGMHGSIEYKIQMADGKTLDVVFMHCNARDHTVAFGMPCSKRINHVMIEVESFDDVGLTYDIVRRNKIPILMTPGRHANDQMYSFYFLTPSGWMCEVGWGGRSATHQSEYYDRDTYGHEFQNVL